MSRSALASVDAAIDELTAGRPILVHDASDREHEVDILYPAGAIDASAVSRLRNDAGGLIFVALPDDVAEAFDLPFMHEAIDHPSTEYEDVGYDARPSFSLSVNHRETYTGVTDNDRALTIQALANAASHPPGFDFATEFRSPGHVHILRGAPDLLTDRQGHTELGLALAAEATGVDAIAGAEMLDDTTGEALAPGDARAYASRWEYVFVEGTDIVTELR